MFSFRLCLAGAFSIRTAKQSSFVTPLLQVAGSLKACTKDCSVFTVAKVNLCCKSCKKKSFDVSEDLNLSVTMY